MAKKEDLEEVVEEEIEEVEEEIEEVEEEIEEIAARVAEEPLPEGKMTQDEFLESIGLSDRPGSHMAVTAWAEYQAS